MASVQPVELGFFPLDDELALLSGELTPRLQEGLVRLSTHIPSFAKAAREFAFWTHIQMHRTSAARITEAAGATAVALQTQAAEHIVQTHPPAPPGPAQLVFSVDGAMVPLLHGVWAEVRTLAVGEPHLSTTAEGQVVVETQALSYFSRLTDSSTFGELATLELHRRGIETAGRVGAVADGAEWCQTFSDLHAPAAVRILDFPHAASYVEAIGQSVGADGALLNASERASLCHDLKHSGPETVVARLRTVVTAAGAPGETAVQLAYLDKRQEQMAYPQFQAEQWPIASAMVESANKLVVEERLKGAGMHWAQQNVNPMLVLRNAVCNERWEEVWKEIEEAQRREMRARRMLRQRQRRASAAREVEASAPAAPATRQRQAQEESGGGVPAVKQPGDEAIGQRRPAADHPWRKAWSIRRQREIAATA